MRVASIAFVLFSILGCVGHVRRLEGTVETNCSGGINQQDDLAELNQCADARNVYAPAGKVVTRPGYVGIVSSTGGAGTQVVMFARKQVDNAVETYVAPTLGVLDLSGLTGRVTSGGTFGRWLIGYSSPFDGFTILVPTNNSNATHFKAEYWNGSAWSYLNVFEITSFSPNIQGAHLSYASNIGFFYFARPQDWSSVTVDGQAAYWLRFNLLDVDFDASVSIDVDDASTAVNITPVPTYGVYVAQFPTSKRYITVSDFAGRPYYMSSASITGDQGTPKLLSAIAPTTTSFAVIPQFEEAFLSYGYRVTRQTNDGVTVAATPETGDFAVGSGAPYDPVSIAQLSTFPQAKYISFFGGRLWFAGLQGEPFTVRWGAAQPFHKVFPVGAAEVLAEYDNSPITGMQPLGEYQVIYKSDSIWMAYPVGPDPLTGVESFAIRQVVAGIGCVSNSSIKSIRGFHIFLAEDGIYSFDGATVKKLSDPLNDTIAAITPGRRPFSAAAHWKTKNLYLLSITTDGSNSVNLVVVFDYKNGTWWLWDNIDAQHWLEDEGANDNEELYFGDSAGRIYRMDGSATDHGGTISSYIKTHRFNYGGQGAIRVRGVEAWCSNTTREVDISVYMNDAEDADTTGTLPFTDEIEDDWDDFSYASGATTDDNWVPHRRRVKRIDMREDGDWFQIKVAHDQKNQKFEMSKLMIRAVELGAR